MAATRSSLRRSATPARAPFVESLPDDLCAEVLSHLTLQERHQALPLVCQRWCRLVHSPALLRRLELAMDAFPEPSGLEPIDRYCSFCSWLQRQAGPHVQQLRLAAPLAHCDAASSSAVAGAREAALACCTALESLCLEGGIETQVGQWLESLVQLKDCTVSAAAVTLAASMADMTNLRRLRLRGHQTFISPEARLPASLTHLCVRHSAEPHVSLQPAGLTQLRQLILEQCFAEDAGSYSILLQLSSLQHLQLLGCFPLPACLPQLRQLQALAVTDTHGNSWDGWDEEDYGHFVAAALAALPALTALELQCGRGMVTPPASLSCLLGLQRFTWWDRAYPAWTRLPDDDTLETERRARAAVPLPAGAWLGALRQLALPVRLLHHNLPALAAAQQLQSISLLDVEPDDCEEAAEAISWAARHAQLRRVAVNLTYIRSDMEQEEEVEELAAWAATNLGGPLRSTLEVSLLSDLPSLDDDEGGAA